MPGPLSPSDQNRFSLNMEKANYGNRVFVILGVSGCGKTTVGKLLSEGMGLPFYDADDFHPKANIDKMSRGLPLDDRDREPWLEILSNRLLDWSENEGAILACSALREKYREKLAEKTGKINWVYLKGSYELILDRMKKRAGHYMGPGMLRSQFDALEEPAYGLVMNIEQGPEQITEQIISQFGMKKKSVFGVYGLGVMGRSLALNIADRGFPLSVFNRAEGGEEQVVSDFMRENRERENVRGFTDLQDFVNSLEAPRSILLMIKAGPVVDQVMEQLLPLLSKGDVLIDGGNSHFTDTARRSQRASELGIGFVGAGISGGEEGARKGPSIMPGGDREDYAQVAGVLEAIAARDRSGAPCCRYIGPGGSGHFVKMVHNGIEYVEMQLLAELYGLLRTRKSNEEIASLFEAWNRGSLKSYLLGITVRILRKKENGEYLLDLILDKAGNKGTGSWSSKAAFDLGVPNTLMASAVFERYLSSFKETRVRLSSRFPGDAVRGSLPNDEVLKQAYAFARMVNHQQGFELLKAASEEYQWDLDFQGISRVWSEGCIIKSALVNRLESLFSEHDDLFSVGEITRELKDQEASVRELLVSGLDNRVSLSCFGASYNYWVGMTSGSVPANLIQAQRDFFGAHTYQRTDDPSGASHHANWE